MVAHRKEVEDMVQKIRDLGFYVHVSHNQFHVEEAPDGCSTPEEPLGSGYWQEFMDRSHLAFEYVLRTLGDHHVMCKDEVARTLVSKISGNLYELYQYSGTQAFDTMDAEEKQKEAELRKLIEEELRLKNISRGMDALAEMARSRREYEDG